MDLYYGLDTSKQHLIGFCRPDSVPSTTAELSYVQAYVLSLMANDDDRVEETTERLTDECYQRLRREHDGIERDSQAVLLFNSDEQTISIQGLRPNVHMAHTLLHRKLSPVGTSSGGSSGHHLVVAVKSTSSEEDDTLPARGGISMPPLHTQSFSPGAESSHDSCYDSDGSPSGSRRSSTAHLNANSHDDVSRTVSDTLAAERADDAVSPSASTLPKHKLLSPTSSLPASIEGTSKKSSPKISSKSSSESHLQQTASSSKSQARNKPSSVGNINIVVGDTTKISTQDSTTSQDSKVSSPETDSSEEFAQSAEYTPKVEFALKLGYSEEQLREVLHKCGRDLSQNELLSQLIQLGSTGNNGASDEVGMDSHLDESFDEDFGAESVDAIEILGNNSGADVVIEETMRDFTGLNISSSSSKSTVLDEPAEDAGNAFMSALLESAKSQDSKSASGKEESNLRHIVIDGSNLAMSHGNKEVFSCVGIKLAVDWFRQRGHKEITVFVPQWRKEAPRPETPIKDQEVLLDLEKENVLAFTPARRIGGKRVVCYDDRYIIKLAAETDGIVVSNDHYKDLVNESTEFKKVIEERLLMFTFVNDRFMPPDDPLGRHGPSLDNYLLKEPTMPEPTPPICPYAKKCTYGNKCKFYHPERGSQPHKSVTDMLAENSQARLQKVRDRKPKSRDSSPGDMGYNKKALTSTLSESGMIQKKKLLTKTASVPNRAPVGRTKSVNVAPSIMVTSAASGITQAQSITSAPDLGGHPRLTKTTSTFTVGDRGGIKVTLTSATPDVEKWKSYDDLLTGYRKKMEESEAQEKERLVRQRVGFIPHVDSEGSLVSQSVLDNASLQPPQQWSQQSGHESLRHTHSDPPGMHYQDSTSNLGGHLALAKTLSDEGTHPEDTMPAVQRNMAPQARRTMTPSIMGQPGHIRQRSPKGRKVSPHSQPEMPVNQHKKLQRQLSLKGDEDPRVQQHKYRDAGAAGPMQAPPMQFPHPQLQKRQSAPATGNKPSYRFHGQEGPHNPHIRFVNQPSFTFSGGDPMIPPGWQQEPPHSAGPKMMLPKKEKAPLVRHSSFGPTHPLMHPVHRQHQQVQGHSPLGRMSSAPGTYFTKSQDQENERLAIPRMTRQNSTSDPQLHAHLTEDQYNMGIPFESYSVQGDQDSLRSESSGPWHQGTGSFDEIHCQIPELFPGQRQGLPPNVNFGVPPPPVPSNSQGGYNEQCRRPSGPLDQDRAPQIRTPPNVPYGQQGPLPQQYVQFGSNQIKLPVDPETAIFDPSVPPPNHPALNHPPNPGPIHTPPRNTSPARQDTSPLTMSPVHRALCQQRSGNDQYRMSPPPPIQPPSASASDFNLSSFGYGQLPMASPHSGSAPFSPRSSEYGSREHLAAIGSGRPPHSAQEPMMSAIVSPDTRESIYYHLSGLFPEDKVQAVMEAFPNETDPKVLCAHIIKMN